jgi:hypothetical protein
MNERIKELAIQAGFFYEDYKDIWYLEYHNESCEEEMEKFAELIVRECAEWMAAEQDEKGDGISDNFYWSARMKKHFGVEE